LDPDEASNRPATLLLLSEFTEAARDYKDNNKISPTVNNSLLMPYKDEVLGVFTVGLNASSTRNAALSGLNAMVATQGLLSNEELAFIVHNVDQVLEGEQDDIDDSK
jgi:DNA repair/transcription protein MET18/MMS19